MANPVVHFEILSGGDPGPLQRFYAETFGWTVDANNPANYGLVSTGVEGTPGGGIDRALDGAPRTMIYIEVDDPEAYLAKVAAAGGRVVQGVNVVPGMVTFAQSPIPRAT
jgi:uncharacterized protein